LLHDNVPREASHYLLEAYFQFLWALHQSLQQELLADRLAPFLFLPSLSLLFQ
jgi:hypothetical protein